MILVAHPFGNANVRAVLATLDRAGLLARFVTTLGWSKASVPGNLPKGMRTSLGRRSYELPREKIKVFPGREVVRLLAQKGKQQWLVRHERGWASIDRIWRELDGFAANVLRKSHQTGKMHAVYGYEDCADQLFHAAREIGVRRIYELPIAYWQTARSLLEEEAVRYPEWKPTLAGTADSEEKLARKTRELDLAELVICPSAFVLESLPERIVGSKPCLVVPFGSPAPERIGPNETRRSGGPLRVLFVGALTQRKGLADLFEAMKLVDSNEVELVVMGSLLRPLAWYRRQFPRFTYEPPRAQPEVLRLMRSCDLLVLPSIVEGRALVQQEAMACGLPLVVTKNAGGDDLVVEGETGFLVPIRAPMAIAEKIDWFAANRERIAGMAIATQKRASERTWQDYGEKILGAIQSLTGK